MEPKKLKNLKELESIRKAVAASSDKSYIRESALEAMNLINLNLSDVDAITMKGIVIALTNLKNELDEFGSNQYTKKTHFDIVISIALLMTLYSNEGFASINKVISE